jgi:hypothetical protein
MESNFDFADITNDGKLDVMYLSPFSSPFFEYIRGQ